MAKTKLTRDLQSRTLHHLIQSIRLPREEGLKRLEHELARRLVLRRFGEDVFERCAALPKGWLSPHATITFVSDMRQHFPHQVATSYKYAARHKYGWFHFEGSMHLADPRVLPNLMREPWNRGDCGELYDAVHGYFADWLTLHEELERLDAQVAGALSGFRYVEDLAQHWPEGYAHFPQDALSPVANLPAVPLDDLNARIEAMRQGVEYE